GGREGGASVQPLAVQQLPSCTSRSLSMAQHLLPWVHTYRGLTVQCRGRRQEYERLLTLRKRVLRGRRGRGRQRPSDQDLQGSGAPSGKRDSPAGSAEGAGSDGRGGGDPASPLARRRAGLTRVAAIEPEELSWLLPSQP